MRKIIMLMMMIFIIFISSCDEKKKEYPSINFIGGNGLISQNSILGLNKTFKIGINSFTESDSKLYNFRVIRIFENESEVVLDSIINKSNYNTIISLPTSNTENNERWEFSMMCDDGYTSEIGLTIKTTNDTLSTIRQSGVVKKQYIQRDIPGSDMSEIPFYIGIGALLILAFIVYLIKKPKKDYDCVIVEEVKKMKESIFDKIDSQDEKFNQIDIFINKKIEEYEKQIKELNDKLNAFPRNKSYLIPMIISILISMVLFTAFLFSNFLLL